MGKKANVRIEHLRKGRRLYGGFHTFEDGRRLYVAYRKHNEIYRGRKKSISEALRDGTAAWAIDVDTLAEVKARGIDAVAVRVKESGDLYITRLANFYDPEKVLVLNFASRGGSLQRFLPLEHWKLKPGRVRI